MDKNTTKLPELNASSFACLHCGVLAQQDWSHIGGVIKLFRDIIKILELRYRTHTYLHQEDLVKVKNFCIYFNTEFSAFFDTHSIPADFHFSKCHDCNQATVWYVSGGTGSIIYPKQTPFPSPNKDMDSEIQTIYNEANEIFQHSPRASAALLRLCVEKLCKQIGCKTGSFNGDIGELVKNGLPEQIQQALDYCRVIGNNSVHPGEINFDENIEHVEIMFGLVNDIADHMITKHKQLNEKYSSLPKDKLNGIQQRDNKTT